ncbi:MAG: RHS repeat-associated core domain-containing protein, partial [Candidatus Peribacteraceae bacterium]|nr:RHS repeat-associated core domain-containing protein [Candidatus Peribacteraceae bacterium]
TYRYTPFGGSLVKDETVYNPYQFTGRRYDPESGMYYYRARMYESGMGRFVQADPAGMVDGANMYAYVGNNPVNQVDPTGKWSWWCRQRGLYKIKTWSIWYRSTASGWGWQLHFAVGSFIGRKGCNYADSKDVGWRIEYVASWSGSAMSEQDVVAVMWGWYYHRQSEYRTWWGGKRWSTSSINLAKEIIPKLSGSNYVSNTYGVGLKIQNLQYPPQTAKSP